MKKIRTDINLTCRYRFLLAFIVLWLLYLPTVSANLSISKVENLPDDNPYKTFENKKEMFSHQKNYIPGQPLNTSVKTIFIAMNIWQNDDGSGNFPESDLVVEKLEQVIFWLNNIFRSSPPTSDPIAGIEYLKDSHIRFELKDVGFYHNTELNNVGCNDGIRLNQAVFDISPEKRKYLNIHLTTGSCQGASGYAIYPSRSNFDADAYVVSFLRDYYNEPENYPWWALMLHIAHEIGHVMELRHPYNSEFCQTSHPDFLSDLFGFEKQDWCTNPRPGCDICYHDGSWECDRDDPETTCTNNIMGGNRSSGSITPLQMGRMNRALVNTSMRKYAWGYSDIPFIIDGEQTWDGNYKFYQDIVVSNGSKLHITGRLEMVSQSSIIVESGGELIVDGGVITNALYEVLPWQGVTLKPEIKKGFLFWRKIIPEAKLIIINEGRVNNFVP